MSGVLFRNHDAAVGLAVGFIFRKWLGWGTGKHMAVQIEAAIVAGTPDNGLAWLIRDGAAFVGAFGAEGKDLLVRRLENDDSLAAYRHDDELLLLELPGFIARQPRRASGAGLRQRF